MKYLKEFWTIQDSQYLIGKDTQNEEKILNFFKYFKINNLALDIWNFLKNNYGIFPNEITPKKISYITKDGCKLELKLNETIEIIKTKMEYKDGEFVHNILCSYPFSFEILKKLIA